MGDDADDIRWWPAMMQAASGTPGDGDNTKRDFDAGSIGMELGAAFESHADLTALDAQIAAVEQRLRRQRSQSRREDDVENMVGSPMPAKKRFMTIRDLPPDPFPDIIDEDMQAPVSIDVGRRLKDGAYSMALRAPVFGYHTPFYIEDMRVIAAVLAALVILVAFVIFLRMYAALARRLHASEKQAMHDQMRAARLSDAIASRFAAMS
jgi:hypothetical protein